MKKTHLFILSFFQDKNSEYYFAYQLSMNIYKQLTFENTLCT